jgi:hypothetical protein
MSIIKTHNQCDALVSPIVQRLLVQFIVMQQLGAFLVAMQPAHSSPRLHTLDINFIHFTYLSKNVCNITILK